MPIRHESLIARQFGEQADAYVASAVHAQGVDLDRIEAVAKTSPGAAVLDLGSGGGHVSYRVAPHSERVIACDLSAGMLAAVKAEAVRRGLSNILTLQGAAEALPLGDASVDLVICRYSAHHWRDFEAGLREARRVVKLGGRAVFIDVVAPASAVLDTHLQTVELLRDPSHVRDYCVHEWVSAAEQAGFHLSAVEQYRLPLAFDAWAARMRTPEIMIQAIRSLQRGASDDVRSAFEIAADGGFVVDTCLLELRSR